MSWVVLIISAVLEAVWATALGESDGLSQPVPTVVFLVALTASMIGLGYAA
ncbi:MAG: SMR family transporter, partial [Microbacterium gubbeenense]